MTEKNMIDEPFLNSDVTELYAEFNRVPKVVPTKKETRQSRLANSSHLSKGSHVSRASSMSRHTGGSIEQTASPAPPTPASPSPLERRNIR